jgi:hypothetical protein
MPEIDITNNGWEVALPAGKHFIVTPSGGGKSKITRLATQDVFLLDAAGGAAAANALLMGIGTSASPATTAVADKVFIELRTQSSATSGTSRSLYLRHNLSGAGQSGETIRAFTDLTAAVSTARGAQISLQAGATGYVTGLGAGVDAQLYVKNEVLAANGTYTALNAEIYSAGSTTAVSGVTQLSFIRLVAGGDATGAGRVDDKAFLVTLTGGANGSGNIVDAAGNEPTWNSATHKIRVNMNGTTMYLVAVLA